MRAVMVSVRADVKKLLMSPKFMLILLLALFFVFDFARSFREMAASSFLGIPPYLYALFVTDFMGEFYTLMLIVIMMSDAPFYNQSEVFIGLRISRIKWLWGKAVYIFFVSVLLQSILVILSAAVCLPHLGFGEGWGVIFMNYLQSTEESISYTLENTSSSLLAYEPMVAMLLLLGITILLSTLLGILIFTLNMLCHNYTGTILVGVLSCIHTYIKDFNFYHHLQKVTSKIPMSWMNITNYQDGMTPGMAMLFLSIMIVGLFVINAVLLKTGKTEMIK
ncbi:MAG: hypothetical protein E7269_06985 [Lachnospiraceae bacterium]|nr:hypothetical protein [Lachnospiraceae bacterium]